MPVRLRDGWRKLAREIVSKTEKSRREVLEVARSMYVRALLFVFMEIDEGHNEYLYKMMTTSMQRKEKS